MPSSTQLVRIPLAYPVGTRDASSLDKDPYIRNGMIEQYGKTFRVIKRPGSQREVVQPAPFGTGQGIFFYNGFYYLVVSDVLYRTAGADMVAADGINWTQSAVPSWYGRAALTATLFLGRIWVIGGEASFLYADVSSTVDGVTWVQNASGAPFGHRQGHQVVVLNNTMYLLGGYQNDNTTNALMNDVWSTQDGSNWTLVTAAAQWAPRDNFTAVAANNGIYLYGGDLGGGTLSDEVWFSVDGKDWTQLTATATGVPRFVHSMVFFKNLLWIIGGNNGTTSIDAVSSSPDGQVWTTTAPVWGAGRSLMAATIYHDKIWLFGGAAPTVVDSDVWSSDNGTTWTLVTTTPGWTPRGLSAAVTYQTPDAVSQFHYETMWLLGGNDGATDLQEVWRANLDVNSPTSYALSPDVSGQRYQFATYMNGTKMVLKNQSNFWVLSGGNLTKVTDPNYPTTTVPGIVELGAFLYVMTPGAEIHSCQIDDPLTWPSLNFITADYEDDPGIALAKHLNFVVALGQSTTQFFYDNGANQPVGSALAPYQSANMKIGCAIAYTVVNCGGTLYWMATSTSNARTVIRLNGVTPEVVSTFYVDRVVGDFSGSGTFAFEFGTNDGRSLYVLSAESISQLLVFDTKFSEWYEWDRERLGTMAFATSFQTGQYMCLDTDGQMVLFAQTIYDDDGFPFDCSSQTPKEDYGNLFRKFWGRASLICNQTPGTVTIEVSDDDYQNYTTLGTVDPTLERPNLTRLGSSRRRSWRLTQTDSEKSVFMQELEVSYSQGESF